MIDFGRTMRFRVGPSGSKGRDFSSRQSETGLRMRFKATRSSAREPNTLEAQIYNLNPESRSYVEREGLSIIVEAGYQDRTSVFFIGDVARGWSEREDGVTWLTKFEGGDGERAFRSAKVNVSFEAGVTSDVIFRRLALDLGVPLGYVTPRVSNRAQAKVYPRGWSYAGPVRDGLDELLEDLEVVWSIQDGELVATGQKEATEEPAVIVRAENLVAPPAPILEDGEFVGLTLPLKLSSLYRPERLLDVKLRDFAGIFRVTKVEHDADSGFDAPFNSTCETRALGS